jgi:hypothetical protein
VESYHTKSEIIKREQIAAEVGDSRGDLLACGVQGGCDMESCRC